MLQVLFDFPLPNSGERYDLSAEELVKLLTKAYEKGKKDALYASYTVSADSVSIASSEPLESEWR